MKHLLFLTVLLAGCASSDSDRAALKEELKHEILAELHEAHPENTPPPSPTGDVEGRLVFMNKGIAGCHVKLVRLLESQSFLGIMNEVRLGTEFETVSDGEGRFRFQAVPLGPYRLFWQVPGDIGWIRRLREKPDAIVETGTATRVPDIDLRRRPVAEDPP